MQLFSLWKGTQTVRLAFDGQLIGDNRVNGQYKVQALSVTLPDTQISPIIEPTETLSYHDYTYQTRLYKASDFIVTAALFSENISHQGIDENGNGLFESITIDIGLNISIPSTFLVSGDLYDGQGNYLGNATWTGTGDIANLKFEVAKTQPPYTLGNLILIDQKGPLLDSRYYQAYEINDLAGLIETGFVTIGNPDENDIEDITPGTFTFTLVDTDIPTDGQYDILRVIVNVIATDAGDYRIEGLLVDEYGSDIAWSVSDLQHLNAGSQTMTLELNGKQLYDQLPVAPATKALKLVAVKIFSGNLSQSTLEGEAQIAATTSAYTRSQFEPSSPAINLFQDDLENSTGNWDSLSQCGA